MQISVRDQRDLQAEPVDGGERVAGDGAEPDGGAAGGAAGQSHPGPGHQTPPPRRTPHRCRPQGGSTGRKVLLQAIPAVQDLQDRHIAVSSPLS